MGTNLSQVFIANAGNLKAASGTGADSLSGLASTPEIGIWNLAADGNGDHWLNTALYAATVDTDTSNPDDTTVAALTVANPLWLYRDLQFAQGTSGNSIATPLINTRDIKRLRFEPHVASVGHKQVITGTPASGKVYRVKFIIRNTPTDQLSFYDASGNNYPDLSGAGKDFPLGAFNTTNHKAITVEITTTSTTLATETAKIKAAVEANKLLNEILVVSTTTVAGDTYTARHAGVVFDMIIWNDTDDAAALTVTPAGAVIGVGNDWQVLGEEIRCRSRYGNFNRMYLPQNMPTYTVEGNAYHKITIEYAHNWPSSTGIAPAGELNQVVLYLSDSSTAMVAGDTTIDTAFVLGDLSEAVEFVW